MFADGWAAGVTGTASAPVLVDQHGGHWAPTGRVRMTRDGETAPLYALTGVVAPVRLVAQSTRTDLERDGLRLRTLAEVLAAGRVAEQRHQFLDPAEPPVSAAGQVAA